MVVSLVVALVAGACTGGASSPARQGSPLSGHFHLTFDDKATAVSCPPGVPAGDGCFVLAASTHTARYGSVHLGPTFDVEAPASSAGCGAPATYATRLRTPFGSVKVAETGPRLCLDVERQVTRTFTVVSGTARYRHATGSGTVTWEVGAVGVVETWTGHVTL